ncbi:hypothetical protein DICVIV_14383 [Dictyocaulus viviparus]|uniref:CC domain-containing protein n=1 Tax=Dictyocaulus viviparus TaxID=29172 RepID=A0A0D8XB91_DICVI|nr:hypothetical protein DICVIV_14383 [Dictyocaulus viviparus]
MIMNLKVLLLIACLHLVQTQLEMCLNGGYGPCLGDLCPLAGSRCITTANGRLCCLNQFVS